MCVELVGVGVIVFGVCTCGRVVGGVVAVAVVVGPGGVVGVVGCGLSVCVTRIDCLRMDARVWVWCVVQL